MLPPSAHSRRALVAGAALAAVAVAPRAAARKRKQPPLAFISVTMTAVRDFASGSDRAFEWTFNGAIYHPESDTHFLTGAETGVLATLSAKAARAALISNVQVWARSELQRHGQEVQADRIEVILI
jgi:hypothetical protein